MLSIARRVKGWCEQNDSGTRLFLLNFHERAALGSILQSARHNHAHTARRPTRAITLLPEKQAESPDQAKKQPYRLHNKQPPPLSFHERNSEDKEHIARPIPPRFLRKRHDETPNTENTDLRTSLKPTEGARLGLLFVRFSLIFHYITLKN